MNTPNRLPYPAPARVMTCPVCATAVRSVDRHDDPDHPGGVCPDCCLQCHRHPRRLAPGLWRLGRFLITHQPPHEIRSLRVDEWTAVSVDGECVIGERRAVLEALRDRTTEAVTR